ncbi:MAG TPA: methyltransferase domain-containing protein [Solirubrobacteraceae bacterium]|nr:methyltransferase domain-containing protein [Solirubrobacteraceae bacterium]
MCPPDPNVRSSRWRSYRDVDDAVDPAALGAYMDQLAALPAVVREKSRSLGLLDLRAGDSCLDVGCGTGREIAALAAIVGPHGRVVGVDRSEALTAAARDRDRSRDGSPRERVSPPAPGELIVGDAHRLPFGDAEFHACRADRTLQHVAAPETALAEMARVTRPGGRVVVTEFRWGLVAPSLDRAVTDHVLSMMASPGDREEWLGHRLVEMFEAAGLTETRATGADYTLDSPEQIAALMNLEWSVPAAVDSGVVTTAQAVAWERTLRQLAADGEAFAGIVFQHVAGVR